MLLAKASQPPPSFSLPFAVSFSSDFSRRTWEGAQLRSRTRTRGSDPMRRGEKEGGSHKRGTYFESGARARENASRGTQEASRRNPLTEDRTDRSSSKERDLISIKHGNTCTRVVSVWLAANKNDQRSDAVSRFLSPRDDFTSRPARVPLSKFENSRTKRGEG